MLRDYLTGWAGWDRQDRRERYGKIERVLLAFLRDETLSRLTVPAQEMFPLPEESVQ